MTTTKLLCFVALLAACGDKKTLAKDADLSGDGAPGDGITPDAPACLRPALPACTTPVAGSTVRTRSIGSIPNDGAMLVTAPPNDPRLFVVGQSGIIWIFENETRRTEPFLDISAPVAAGGEQGLLGLAFHPLYDCNGLFFVFYTTQNANVVARCSVSADPNIANPTCTPILSIPDFASNHNGGMIEFGADGFLYIGTGDGGGGGDPQRTAQNTNNLLGKILRIDVDTKAPGKEYGIPSDNPYATAGGAPEVFMLGLRNPWRWSFDRATGDMWIGDVGQNQTEELNVLRPAQQKGANLGWSKYEGNACCDTQQDNCSQNGTQYPCDMTGLFFPQDTRVRGATGWVSIIAGQTYRGSCYPDLVGWHFYADYQAAGLVKARLMANDALEIVNLPGTFPNGEASIHADARGELYITTTGGAIHHLEAVP